MTPYTVDWTDDAEDELCRVWMQASDPAAVTRASDQAERLLAQDPLGNGQHQSGGLYHIVVPPITLTYTVNAKQRHVQVNGVHYRP